MKARLLLVAMVCATTFPAVYLQSAVASEEPRQIHGTSAYVRAVLMGSEEECRALRADWDYNYRAVATADILPKDMEAIITVAQNGKSNAQHLALLLVGRFCTYRANTALIALMDSLDGPALMACIGSVRGQRYDPRIGPAVLKVFEKYVRDSDRERMLFAADVLGYSLGYRPAGEPIASQLKALATGAWWQRSETFDAMAKLTEALGGVGYEKGAELYNSLLREAAPHFFKEGAVEKQELRVSQARFLEAGVKVADKATVMEYVGLLGLKGDGEAQWGWTYMGFNNLKDVVQNAIEHTAPWLEVDADSPEYRAFAAGKETLNDLYLGEVAKQGSAPLPNWLILDRVEERRLAAALPTIESWCDQTEPLFLKLKYAMRMARLGSRKAADALLSIARAGDPVNSDIALQMLMYYTCANCGRDWDAWQALIEREKKELKRDAHTGALGPVEVFEALEK